VMMTHAALERDMERAIAEIDALAVTREKTTLMRVL